MDTHGILALILSVWFMCFLLTSYSQTNWVIPIILFEGTANENLFKSDILMCLF